MTLNQLPPADCILLQSVSSTMVLLVVLVLVGVVIFQNVVEGREIHSHL